MKEFNYVYLTTNLVNGKQYVGDHSSNNLEKDNYLGSGKLIIHAIKKYKKENFRRQILEFFTTKEEAFNAQEKWINKFDTLIPNGYNISHKGGYGVPDSYLNKETKDKIGNSNKGKIRSKEAKENLRKIHLGKKQSKETIEKRRIKLIGKSHPCSNETKAKISKTKTGTLMKNSSKEKLRIFQTGKIRSNETKIKMSICKRKLTDIQIIEIKEKLNSFAILEIAKEFNVSRGVIDRINKNILLPIKTIVSS